MAQTKGGIGGIGSLVVLTDAWQIDHDMYAAGFNRQDGTSAIAISMDGSNRSHYVTPDQLKAFAQELLALAEEWS